MNADDIRKIFDECGTDKGSHHGYAPVYADLTIPQAVLEIGVQYGHSLASWRRIWPEARVYGVDLYTGGIRDDVRADPMVTICEGDATLQRFAPLDTFQLIVEDGFHKPQDQVAIFRHYWPCLRVGGTYIIEDVTDPHFLYRECHPRGSDPELRRTGTHFDDVVLLFRK